MRGVRCYTEAVFQQAGAAMSNDKSSTTAEAMFEKALDIAEKHLEKAIADGGPLGPYVAVAMIEAAVNVAVDETSHEDVVDMLRDLANQIEADGEAAEDDED
jgi:hypothetical protein